MSTQAYDQKNQNDFDEYSQTLNEALLEIQNNNKLKPTIAQLSYMTGIHRNTIRSRSWPVQKLNEIKESRAIKEQNKIESEKRNRLSTAEQLKENLDQTRAETVYWFNEYQDMKRSFEHSDKRFMKMRDAREYYMSMYEEEKKRLLKSEQEIDRLRDLLDLTN